MAKQDMNFPRKGMNTDTHIDFLTEEEYVYMLNGNIINEDGSGTIVLQNEHSNLLCSKFKDGYVVVGIGRWKEEFYFALTNPITGKSEIGMIFQGEIKDLIDLESKCNCNVRNKVSEPLETIEQEETCEYITLISDNCDPLLEGSGGFEFSINHPLRIVVKKEKGSTFFYFTQKGKNLRVIDLEDLIAYKYKDGVTCDSPKIPVCLNLEKIKIFKTFKYPCLDTQEVNGGNLPEGSYLFKIAYCDENGLEKTRYMAHTYVKPIKNPNKFIYSQTETEILTNYAINIEVRDIDLNFTYYKIVSLQKSSLNGALSTYLVGIFSTTNSSCIYANIDDSKRIAGDLIFKDIPIYDTVDDITSANGYLFASNLSEQKPVNLQPIANLMGQHVKWRVSIADKDLYKTPNSCQDFRSFPRHEVFPLGIRFNTNTGYTTHLYHFIGRVAEGDEEDIVVDINGNVINYGSPIDIESILKNGDKCSDVVRNKRWQYDDTSSILGDLSCANTDIEPPEPLTITQTATWNSPNVSKGRTIYNVSIEDLDLEKNEIFSNVENYINKKLDRLLDINDPLVYLDETNSTLTLDDDIVFDAPTQENIDDLFGSNCDTNENLISTSIELIDMLVDLIIKHYELLAYYNGKIPNFSTSSVYIFDRDTNSKIVYDTQKSNYANNNNLLGYYFGIISNTYGGDLCGDASIINFNVKTKVSLDDYVIDTNTSIPPDADYIISNKSTTAFSLSPYSYTIPHPDPSTTNLEVEITINQHFTSNLHKNAKWFKVTSNIDGKLTILISKKSKSDLSQEVFRNNYLRYSIYQKCSDTNIVSNTPGNGIYSLVPSNIYDVTNGIAIIIEDCLVNSTFYIAIDSPIINDSRDVNMSIFPNSLIASGSSKYISGTDFQMELSVKETEINSIDVTYEALFSKSYTYSKECTYFVQGDLKCNPFPIQEGKFGYVESTFEYPNNDDLYNSQKLIIEQSDFLNGDDYNSLSPYFTNGSLNDKADFRCEKIRHFKFPGQCTTPSFKEKSLDDYFIFPMGIFIDNQTIKDWLQIAVKNSLITQEFKDSIIGYEIFRGDRKLHQSVQANGIMFDMWEYDEADEKRLLPNFPYNDNRDNKLLRQGNGSYDVLQHPYNGIKNHRFSFLSPDTLIQRDSKLGNEMIVHGQLEGTTNINFQEAKDYSKYIVLSHGSDIIAGILTTAEIALDVLEVTLRNLSYVNQSGPGRFYLGIGTNSPPDLGALIPLTISSALNLASNIFFNLYKFEIKKKGWLDIIEKNGIPINFAKNYIGVGSYNKLNCNQELRGLLTNNFLRPRIYSFNEIDNQAKFTVINNLDRESSNYINFGEDYFINESKNKDNSRESITSAGLDGSTWNNRFRRNISAISSSIVTYLPSQYGSIDSVKWINTGYCGRLNEDNSCDIIYGGDTFISPFSIKRKYRFFLQEATGDLVPYRHTDYRNALFPAYYLNYKASVGNLGGLDVIPQTVSNYNFDISNQGTWYYEKNSTFYLYYYGFLTIPVESIYNLHYRTGTDDLENNFYPNVNPYSWIDNVPIEADNTFTYRNIYSWDGYDADKYVTLPSNYDKFVFDKMYDIKDRLIYSNQDTSEQITVDNWQFFHYNNKIDFGSKYGNLISATGIDNQQVLVRFEDGAVVFNAFDVLKGNEREYVISSNGMFKTPPKELVFTDLGYAGTQHKALLNCIYGRFWVDAKRGQVINENGKIENIAIYGKEQWFKENLPFNIIKDIPNMDVDNSFKGIGITMGWDNRFERVFITKLDKRIKEEFRDKFIYENDEIKIETSPGVFTTIEYDNEMYMDDYSWTIAFAPKYKGSEIKGWIGYYSFKPNYYIDHFHYFQTGKNFGEEKGLWSHLLTNKSFQVFYGKLYPFVIELPMINTYVNTVLKSIEYWLDVRRYHNEQDYAEHVENFDEAMIYNRNNFSGILNLVTQLKNNIRQLASYPKYNSNSIDILSTHDENRWTINSFFNRLKSNYNVPIFNYKKDGADKTFNNKNVEYKNKFFPRLKGEHFVLRLTQFKKSSFKYIFLWSKNNRNKNGLA